MPKIDFNKIEIDLSFVDLDSWIILLIGILLLIAMRFNKLKDKNKVNN
ncbi:hypothetical protein [Haloplasma contractile]|uniref:Uncharacterized protein n=1 Tax=Haloplasma contractile SSD-17B TaxID=1033810 RepID=U2FJX4_9MOLU|nr:hypothetical protein [Haloplasma contractile]ERJ11529.1 hypothetical protein HLPCO_002441 [Haloplasma contractile SSD-17B]